MRNAFCSRFGLYTLKTIYEGHPAYIRPVSGQAFFYKKSFDKWDYFHKLERWIIGEEVRSCLDTISETFEDAKPALKVVLMHGKQLSNKKSALKRVTSLNHSCHFKTHLYCELF